MSAYSHGSRTNQLTLPDPAHLLTPQQERLFEQSIYKNFADLYYPPIQKHAHIFEPMFGKKNSRHSLPIDVILGLFTLKSLLGKSDEEILLDYATDWRVHYALHLESNLGPFMSANPAPYFNEKALRNFRARAAVYSSSHDGEDLLKEFNKLVAQDVGKIMDIDFTLQRMDSLMIATRAKSLGKAELFFRVIQPVVDELSILFEDVGLAVPEHLAHYLDDFDFNQIVYHDKKNASSKKLQRLVNDALDCQALCSECLYRSESTDLLSRVLGEQTVRDKETHQIRIRKSDDGNFSSKNLQSPVDTTATGRTKANEYHQGYAGSLTEAGSGSESIIIDYDYQTNNYADQKFMEDYLDSLPDITPAKDIDESALNKKDPCAAPASENEYVQKEAITEESGCTCTEVQPVSNTEEQGEAVPALSAEMEELASESSLEEETKSTLDDVQSFECPESAGKTEASEPEQEIPDTIPTRRELIQKAADQIGEAFGYAGEIPLEPLVVDGAYYTEALQKKALNKGKIIIPTALTGKQTAGMDADFVLAPDKKSVVECPAGKTPIKQKYDDKTGSIRISMCKHDCENCPLRELCNPSMKAKVANKTLTETGRHRSAIKKLAKDKGYIESGKYRNGVEACAGDIRLTYGADHDPQIGLIRGRFSFGMKVGAHNAKKVIAWAKKNRPEDPWGQCAQISAQTR